jgi:hypothetical protein
LKDAVWFLLITAIGIPVGGTIESIVSSRFNRATTRETALLAARQRRRDAEISQLRDAMTDLFDAATAVQSFAWFVDDDARLSRTVDKEAFRKHGDLFERAVTGAQRLRAIARAMPTEELRE